MVLVLLGTQDKSFKRLLKAVDKEIEKGTIKEKVVVQAGHTKYKSKNMEIFDFKEPEEIKKLISKSNVVITHGGVGSILDSISRGKPVIAAARLSKYKEHTNDHQVQIIDEFEKEGYIIALRDFDKLGDAYKEAKKFVPKKYKSNNKNFTNNIEKYINETNNISFINKYPYVYIIVILIIILLIIFS